MSTMHVGFEPQKCLDRVNAHAGPTIGFQDEGQLAPVAVTSLVRPTIPGHFSSTEDLRILLLGQV